MIILTSFYYQISIIVIMEPIKKFSITYFISFQKTFFRFANFFKLVHKAITDVKIIKVIVVIVININCEFKPSQAS